MSQHNELLSCNCYLCKYFSPNTLKGLEIRVTSSRNKCYSYPLQKKDSISIFYYNKIGLLLHFKSCCQEAQARQEHYEEKGQFILQLPSGLMHFFPLSSLRVWLLDGIQQERKKGLGYFPIYHSCHTQTRGTHREAMLEGSQMWIGRQRCETAFLLAT